MAVWTGKEVSDKLEIPMIDWPFMDYDDSAAWRDKPYEERMGIITWYAQMAYWYILDVTPEGL